MKRINGDITAILEAGDIAVQRSGTEWFFKELPPTAHEHRSLTQVAKESIARCKEWARRRRVATAAIGTFAASLAIAAGLGTQAQIAQAATTVSEAKEAFLPNQTPSAQARLDSVGRVVDGINSHFGFDGLGIDGVTNKSVIIQANTCPTIPDATTGLVQPPNIKDVTKPVGTISWDIDQAVRVLETNTNTPLSITYGCSKFPFTYS